MTVAIENEGRGVLSVRITGVASTAAGGIGTIKNPEAVDCIILRASLVVLTPSTGAANLSVGVDDLGDTATTDIINALAMAGVAAKTVYNAFAMQNTAKTAISAPALWQTGYFLTFSGSASTVGLDARLLVEYLRIN